MDKVGHKTLEIMKKAAWYNGWLLKQIKGHLQGEILEVGAGSGNFTKSLSKFGSITTIDYDRDYKNSGFGDIEKGKYFFGNKRKFDVIVCMNVLEHIKDDNRALKNMFSLLNKHGKLILLVPAHMWAYGQMDKQLGHFRRYKTQLVEERMEKVGFKIVENRYLNWLGLMGWFVNAKVLKRKVIPEGQLELFDKIARPLLLLEKFITPPFGLSVLAIGQKS